MRHSAFSADLKRWSGYIIHGLCGVKYISAIAYAAAFATILTSHESFDIGSVTPQAPIQEKIDRAGASKRSRSIDRSSPSKSGRRRLRTCS